MRGAAGIGLAGALHAQAPTIKRTILQKADIPEGKKFEVVLGVAELPAGVTHASGHRARHGRDGRTHADGGRPARQDVQAGRLLAGSDCAVHDAKAGGDGAKVIVSYTVEKGLPLASPAK